MLGIIEHILLFIASLVFLVKGADYLVEFSGRVASKFGVSDFIIGLTVTSIGTSLPELAACISASLSHHSGIVIGNISGSNIANIGLILGISAAFRAFKTEKEMYERDGYIMMAGVLLFFGFVLDNKISFWEALILLMAYGFYLLFLIKSDNKRKAHHFHDFMGFIFDFQYIPNIRKNIIKRALRKQPEERTIKERETVKVFRMDVLKDFALILVCLLVVTLSAKYLIREAEWLAALIGVPESLVGLSLISLGTSLPELTVSLSAARQGKGAMVVGNVLGSNIANILLIIGISGMIHPLQVAEISVVYTIPILLFFSLALLYFVRSDWEIKRRQGLIAVFAYLLFMGFAFVMGLS